MPTTADLLQRVALLESSLNDVKSAMADQAAETDTFFLIWAGALIFLMQCGFAMLSAGSIREKNVKNILLKNLLDACMGALAWYFVGYGFAYNGPTDTVCVEPTSLAWTLLVPHGHRHRLLLACRLTAHTQCRVRVLGLSACAEHESIHRFGA